ncbi:MAG: hypothetical protein U0L49_10910 [Eubacterium sp.]|nr:hypothetical protein [Eubacterium sp.]
MLQLNHTKSGDKGQVSWIAYMIRNLTDAFQLSIGTDLSVLEADRSGVIIAYDGHRVCMDGRSASMIGLIN